MIKRGGLLKPGNGNAGFHNRLIAGRKEQQKKCGKTEDDQKKNKQGKESKEILFVLQCRLHVFRNVAGNIPADDICKVSRLCIAQHLDGKFSI